MSNAESKTRRSFNTAGTCFPELHYMVDVTERLERIRGLFGRGEYFCINRGRQYGKTTTLEALSGFLKDEYTVFQISFEGTDDETFSSLESVFAGFLKKLWMRVRHDKGLVLGNEARKLLTDRVSFALKSLPTEEFRDLVAELCAVNDKPVVVLIDEVDQAGNFDSFVKFLGTLRNMYLDRAKMPTFRSVVLAGVYDVRNLKPIINGTGNYYIEPETRDALRSDMIIDYRGHRYVIEMKIWRGEAYNERGERQLAEYLDRFDVDVGYRISFCFNRNKVPGLKDPVRIGSRTLVEAVV